MTKLFAGAVKAGFEGDDADAGGVGHFLLAAAFLGKGDEGAVGGFEFGEGVAEDKAKAAALSKLAKQSQ